jgi:hypothetical protein
MKETHKTYKPCEYFKEDRCETDNCRYYHYKLKEGEHICYKCPTIFTSKRDIRNHIMEKHSDVICYKFLTNSCNVRRCFFKHIRTSAPNVERTTEQDFPNLHTIRPVVRSQEVAQPQILHPPMPNMSLQVQENIAQITAQAVAQEMNNLMPKLLTLMKEIFQSENMQNLQ